MYVAITRAKRRLYLSRAGSRMLHGQLRYGVRSRFFDEIPAELVQWLARAAAPSFEPTPRANWGEPRSGMSWPAPSRVQSPARPASTPSNFPFRIGQNVSHAKFGDGVVLSCEGAGADARVYVRFAGGSAKWLALQYAKLTPA